ncbi:MAG: AAA family ATPase [Candidatus Njordarchaeia archaeon]
MNILIQKFTEEKPKFIYHDKIQQLYKEIFDRWYSDDQELKDILFASILVKDSKILLIGPPEAGKTTLIRLIAKALSKEENGEIIYSKVTGAPEKTLQRVLISTNITKLIKEGKEEFIVRPIVYARIKFINEINRFSKAVQDGLLSLLEEKEVEYGGKIFKTPNYIAFADMNPYRGDIDRALKTRFLVSVYIPFIGLKGTVSVMDQMFYRRREVRDLVQTLEPLLSFKELEEVWDDIKLVQVPPHVALFGTMLLWAFRACIYDKSKIMPGYLRLVCAKCPYANELCSQISEIPGERAMIASILYSKARAWFYGKDTVTYEDMIWVIPWAVAHRIELVPSIKSETQNPWEWSRNAVKHLIETKWYMKEDNVELFGVWAKGLTLALIALGFELDDFLKKVANTFYQKLLKERDKLKAANLLRKLAYGQEEEKGDLVLQQLYVLVRDSLRPISQGYFLKIKKKAEKILASEDTTLDELLNLINELDNVLYEDALELREKALQRVEDYTIRLSLTTPGMSEKISELLLSEGFSNDDVVRFMNSKRATLSNDELTVTIRGGSIIIRTKILKKADDLRSEFGY